MTVGTGPTAKVFKRKLERHASNIQRWMPMFHDSNTRYIEQRMTEMKCPEEVGQNACPRANVRYSHRIHEEKYCDFK